MWNQVTFCWFCSTSHYDFTFSSNQLITLQRTMFGICNPFKSSWIITDPTPHLFGYVHGVQIFYCLSKLHAHAVWFLQRWIPWDGCSSLITNELVVRKLLRNMSVRDIMSVKAWFLLHTWWLLQCYLPGDLQVIHETLHSDPGHTNDPGHKQTSLASSTSSVFCFPVTRIVCGSAFHLLSKHRIVPRNDQFVISRLNLE